MIQMNTKVTILDKSEAYRAKCVKVLKNHRGIPGNLAVVAVQKARKSAKKRRIRAHRTYKAIIVQCKQILYRKIGSYIKGGLNGIIMLKRGTRLPYSKRIKTVVFYEVRRRGFLRLTSIAINIV